MAHQDMKHQEGRLELLLFRLRDGQHFGISVLKVQEVQVCPALTHLPQSNPLILGVLSLRGVKLSVINLARALNRPLAEIPLEDIQKSYLITTEFNRHTQGFLVDRVERIAICDWKDVKLPPAGLGHDNYLTGVIRIDNVLIEILDVERILAEVVGEEEMATTDLHSADHFERFRNQTILVVDDSMMARKQTARVLDAVGLNYRMARDGKDAINQLVKNSETEAHAIRLIISDIEMPEMDGYSLTRTLRQDNRFSGLYILLHTSLNGSINTDAAQKAGANDFLTKFHADELLGAIKKGLESIS